MLECKLDQSGGVLTVYLTGEIDHHAAGQVRGRIDAQILSGAPELVVLDLSGVSFMDSSGVGLILGRHRLLQSLGGTVSIRGVSGQTAKLLRVAGIHSVLEKGGAAK